LLATGGREVRGVTADGASIVLLRFRANFAGERLRVTLLNDREAMSSSASEDGALSEVPNGGGSGSVPLESLSFAPGQVTITAVKTSKGAVGFALYRAPEDFARNPADANKSQRGTSFQIQSLDLPCFAFGAK
jgi:hypothetical protein